MDRINKQTLNGLGSYVKQFKNAIRNCFKVHPREVAILPYPSGMPSCFEIR